MQHIEEAGVHSGDSACVLPAPSLDPAVTSEIETIVRRIGPALGVVGLLNVQLAVSRGEVFVLEANPRASRTVPFVSKATGVNLVEAACRLLAGAKLHELDLPPEGPPNEVHVKSVVFPFQRLPGSDPGLGPEMHSTGEVMASADNLAEALSKAERAAGRPLPTIGTALLAVDGESPLLLREIANELLRAGLQLAATSGTVAALTDTALRIRTVSSSDPAEFVRDPDCVLVITSPNGIADGLQHRLRVAALAAGVPCITSLAGALAAARAITAPAADIPQALQDRLCLVEAAGVPSMTAGSPRPHNGALAAARAISNG
jgi:carbamoyl-phosphate synthase large subunit